MVRCKILYILAYIFSTFLLFLGFIKIDINELLRSFVPKKKQRSKLSVKFYWRL